MFLNSFLHLLEFFIHSKPMQSTLNWFDKARKERGTLVLILSQGLSFMCSNFATFIKQ